MKQLDLSNNTMLNYASIGAQSATLAGDSSDGRMTVDLGKILFKDNFIKVKNVSAGKWNLNTGIVISPCRQSISSWET